MKSHLSIAEYSHSMKYFRAISTTQTLLLLWYLRKHSTGGQWTWKSSCTTSSNPADVLNTPCRGQINETLSPVGSHLPGKPGWYPIMLAVRNTEVTPSSYTGGGDALQRRIWAEIFTTYPDANKSQLVHKTAPAVIFVGISVLFHVW